MADLFNLHPEVRRRLSDVQAWARGAQVPLTITSGFRSIAQQKRLHAEAVAGKRSLPAAAPGQSTHNYGFAVDMVTSARFLPALVQAAECFGFKWAGKGDPVHFDVFGPAAWRQLLAGGSADVVYHC